MCKECVEHRQIVEVIAKLPNIVSDESEIDPENPATRYEALIAQVFLTGKTIIVHNIDEPDITILPLRSLKAE